MKVKTIQKKYHGICDSMINNISATLCITALKALSNRETDIKIGDKFQFICTFTTRSVGWVKRHVIISDIRRVKNITKCYIIFTDNSRQSKDNILAIFKY